MAYVVDPRFQGGTSAAVARELRLTSGMARVSVHALWSGMLSGATPAPVLMDALSDLRLPLDAGEGVIAADLVVVHNLSMLKVPPRQARPIVARRLVAVTHENLVRPGGAEGFDVAASLSRLDAMALAATRVIAPVSLGNRASIAEWAMRHHLPPGWAPSAEDCPKLVDRAPDPQPDPLSRGRSGRAPADRRGRHSRPGAEKFPDLAALDRCFPAHACSNIILGASPGVLAAAAARGHWQALPFGAMSVAQFLDRIDFLIYFIAAGGCESFGRALAEALAAGKIAISDPATARSFGDGVIGTTPDQVDAVVARLLADPAAHARQLRAGRLALAAYSDKAFARQFGRHLAALAGQAA